MTEPMRRLSINQWSLKTTGYPEFVAAVAAAGIESVGLWRQTVAAHGVELVRKLVDDAGLRVSSLCRGGFLTQPDQQAIDDNLRAIDEAHALGTEVLVMVVGGLERGQSIREVRAELPETLAKLIPHAEQAGVKLALEPMHPMFAADRAVLSTLDDALDVAAATGSQQVGVVVDTYHIWWDPNVLTAIARAGREGRILSYQVSDWNLPLAAEPLNSRGVMGDGFIDFTELTTANSAAGYRGDVEVEIFNEQLWAMPAAQSLGLIRERFERLIAPFI